MPTPSQQLLSRTIYDIDGTTTVWNFAFSGGYIDSSHVKAYTELPNGIRTPIVVTPEMLIGEFQLQISPALLPSAGVLVIHRDTPKDLPLVDFVEGPLSEVALDTNARQAVFIAAEAQDEFASTNYQIAVDAASAAVASAAQANIDANTAANAASAAGSSALVASNAASAAASSASLAAAGAVAAFAADIAAPTGDALVGSDDGAGGSLWSNLAGFLSHLASTAGAAIAGFSWSVLPASINKVDWGVQTAANGVNVLRFVPPSEWSKIVTGGPVSYDATAAVQAAINHCIADRTAKGETLGSGHQELYFPAGFFEVGPLTVAGANGFKMRGAGRQSTQIVFTGSGSSLFAYSTYIGVEISDMSLIAGSVSRAESLPQVIPQATKNNTCIKFNGTGGGTIFTMNRVQTYYWDKVFTTTDNIVNCDNHSHNQCSFIGNNYVWKNTNSQAVVWTFNDCKVFSTAVAVFENPGNSLIVRGGDFINPGTFLVGALVNTSTNLLFDGINFENYQNIDPASAPKFLELSGTHFITFRNCTARGGGTLEGKTSAVLSGIYNILCERCYFTGNWQASVTSSGAGVTSRLVFQECEKTPTVVQTLSGAQGSRPLNLEYRKHPIALQSYIDRVYMGALNTQSTALAGAPFYDSFRMEGTVNASTITKSAPIVVFAPYTQVLTGVRVAWVNAIAAACTITVWQDSTKALKLAEITTAPTINVQQYFEARAGAGLLAIAQLTSTSNPLFVEVTSAGNAGITRSVVTFETAQSTV